MNCTPGLSATRSHSETDVAGQLGWVQKVARDFKREAKDVVQRAVRPQGASR